MSEDKLKGSVTLKRTTNLGNYSSITTEVWLEFFRGEEEPMKVLDALDDQMLHWLEVRGIKNEVKAIPK